MEKKLHKGIVCISSELLLNLLDFQGGAITNISPSRFIGVGIDEINLVIEHPDMPEVKEDGTIEQVCPMLTVHYGDNEGIIRLERTHPPKSVTVK